MPDEAGHTIPDIPYGGAPTIALLLQVNGVAIEGEHTDLGKGAEGAIECIYFSSSVDTVRIASGTGMATGRRNHGPIVIRKRIDKATPLIAKALVQNEIAEGAFKFFRPDPSGSGSDEHFFTIAFEHGRIARQVTYSPDNVALPGHQGTAPFMEEVTFVYQQITWRYEDGGIEFEDSWGTF